MEEKYYILLFSKDWADEFDCEGFAVMIESDWLKLKESVKEYCEAYDGRADLDLGFGTNEELHVDSFDDWYGNITERPVDQETARTIVSLFASDPDDIDNYFIVEPGEERRDWFTYGTGADAMFEHISHYVTQDEE